MQQQTRQILQDLEAVRKSLFALSEDIWRNIDHNDSEALEKGVQFKQVYNEKRAAFDEVASDLSSMLQQYTSVNLEAEEQTGLDGQERNERIIRELNREEPHSIDEDFTYKRPYGFILNGHGTTSITTCTTWRRLLELVCQQLLRRDRERFHSLPNSSFRRDPNHFRKPIQIEAGLYVESSLSANGIRDIILRLLAYFEIPKQDLQLFLREDRDAGREDNGA